MVARRLFGCPSSPLAPAGLALLLLGACDKLTGGDEADPAAEADPAQANKAAAEAEDANKADAKARADAKQAAEAKATAEAEDAKQAAEAKAAADAKAAEQEARRKAEQEARHPVKLSEISVNTTGGRFRGPTRVEVRAKATLKQTLGSSTYVHVKSLCKHDDRLLADVGHLNAGFAKPLDQYAVGEQAEISGTLYNDGLKASLSTCQLQFRVGGLGGGLSIDVGQACWHDGKATDGPCTPPLAPVPMSGASTPLEVHALELEPSGSYGGSQGLKASYVLQINEVQDSGVRITLKSACRVGPKTFADIGQATLTAGPFKYEPGESVVRSTGLYWNSAFEFADPPDDCDLTASLWKTKAGTYGEYEELRLKDACYGARRLREGPCAPAAAPPPAPASLAADSVQVDDVRLSLAEGYGTPGKYQLKIQADVTVDKPVNQNDGINTKVSCKAGRENRVESAYLFGMELHYLAPGETTRMTASAFGSHPLEVKPRSCKVEFFGGPRFSPGGAAAIDLGKFCLKKDKVKQGGKC